MKKVIIVGTYCDTPSKIDLLIDLIKQLKQKNFDIIVYGKYPIPEYVQDMCDYWVYEKSNPILLDRFLVVWEIRYGRKFTKLIKFDWGFTAMEQLIKSLGFAKSLNYDVAYWLNYDTNLENFDLFDNQCDELLPNYSSVLYSWGTSYESHGVSLLSIGFKVHESYEKLKGVVNLTNYKRLTNDSDFIAENVFDEMIKMSELSHFIIKNGPKLNAQLNSFGHRSNGEIPNQLVKTSQYIGKCFIGSESNKKTPVIYISNILVPISEIIFDIGYEELLIVRNPELNLHESIEIDLGNKVPTKLNLLSINGQEINEILDEKLDNEYYECNLLSEL